MFFNYINIAFRNILKHTFYSFLNLSGLAVGIACFILIYLFVSHELSYDEHVPNADNTYRVYTKGKFSDSELNVAVVSKLLGPTVYNKYPEIIDYTNMVELGSEIVKYEENSYKEDKTIFADSSFFRFWGIDLIRGDKYSALKEPQSMVLSEDLAKKIFGEEDPMDKSVRVAGKYEYKITGIVEEFPSNTHFDFELLMSLESIRNPGNEGWLNMGTHCYIKLQPGTDPQAVESKFIDIVIEYVGPELVEFLGASFDEFKESGNDIGFFLEPLTSIYLYSDRNNQLGETSDIKYVYIFSAIGLFILFIACINYMNLATARSSGRAREVGIRKALGAFKGQLIRQFISESVFMAFIAAVTGIVLVFFSIPFFNSISGKSFTPNILVDPHTLFIILAIILFVGLVSGSYPAFFLSAFNPTKVLQKRLNNSFGGSSLRSVLVVFQFAISIFLIIGTIVIYNQMNYLYSKRLGFDKDQILILDNAYMLRESIHTFRDEILTYPEFENATISAFTPVSRARSVTAWWPGDNPNNEKTTPITTFYNDPYFVPTYGIQITKGRNLDEKLASDSSSILINQAAVKYFGLEDPVGQRLGTYYGNQIKMYTVVGVMEDFHFDDLKSKILPLIIVNEHNDGWISFRISENNFEKAVSTLETKWKEFLPGQPFEYRFADQSVEAQYEAEKKVRTIMTSFSVIAIFVACLGLFGLAAFTTEQRMKEIGIRKVMGASINQIVMLLSKDFLKLVAIAFIIASPVAFILMRNWLADFEYSVDIKWWVFLLAGSVTFLIAWVTMSFQSIKAAISNPADSLRTE